VAGINREPKHKHVIMIIKVPYGDSCFNQDTICSNFKNDGGIETCALGLDSRQSLESDSDGNVLKPLSCYELDSTFKGE